MAKVALYARYFPDNGASHLSRSMVPAHFPQFRNAAALAHLAHCGRGPRYVIVGGRAWYDPADIRQWLESRKTTGPLRRSSPPQPQVLQASPIPVTTRKRGRPTKLEQMSRRQGARAVF